MSSVVIGVDHGAGPDRTAYTLLRPVRIAFCGASGTGKTTLTEAIARELMLPINPIGSRSVAKEMGFASPYDVDAAGRRAEFQRRLLESKTTWEGDIGSFVTDRTTVDNLAYTLMHDARAIDRETLLRARNGFERYTHVFFCSAATFCSPGDDPARVSDPTYAKLYEWTLDMLLTRLVRQPQMPWRIQNAKLPARIAEVMNVLNRGSK